MDQDFIPILGQSLPLHAATLEMNRLASQLGILPLGARIRLTVSIEEADATPAQRDLLAMKPREFFTYETVSRYVVDEESDMPTEEEFARIQSALDLVMNDRTATMRHVDTMDQFLRLYPTQGYLSHLKDIDTQTARKIMMIIARTGLDKL